MLENTSRQRIYLFRKDYSLVPILIVLAITSIIMPNSFPLLTAGGLLLGVALCILLSGGFKLPRLYRYFFSLSIATTLLYLFVGWLNGANSTAFFQVIVIYILSPLLWTILIIYILERYGLQRVCRFLAFTSFFCALSVGVYVFIVYSFGTKAAVIFIDSPNVYFGDGNIETKMYVHGSLIFLTAGLVAAPRIIPNSLVRIVVFIAVLMAVLSSGRSALLMALPIGGLVGIASSFRGRFSGGRVLSFIFLALVVAIAVPIFTRYFGLSLASIVTQALGKFDLGVGHDGRAGQFWGLLESATRSYGLGRGHGVGISLIRNELYPWRYEMVWLATLHRVGIFGTICYAAPFIAYILASSRAVIERRMTVEERYVFAGFLAAFFASNTNPYIEGFVFQWMYIFPVTVWILGLSMRGVDVSKATASSELAMRTVN